MGNPLHNMGDFGLGFVDKEIEFDTADFSEWDAKDYRL